MRSINLIVVHCSATRADHALTTENLESEHRRRGFHGIGYHYYICRDGTVVNTRALELVGAHVKGHNAHSIGICYEGGLNEEGQPADTRTYAQKCSLLDLLRQLKTDYPKAKILGHYQLSKLVHKACPCFDAAKEYEGVSK